MRITNEDHMKMMARYPDGYFDLAIVDPPYGILNKTKRGGDYKFNMAEYTKWDIKPKQEFFNELFRVSKKWIINLEYFGEDSKSISWKRGDDLLWYRDMKAKWSNYDVEIISDLEIPEKIDSGKTRLTVVRKL